MAKNNNLTDFLTGISNAIRTKKGTTGLINPQNFESEISSIASIDTCTIEYMDESDPCYFVYSNGSEVDTWCNTANGTVLTVVCNTPIVTWSAMGGALPLHFRTTAGKLVAYGGSEFNGFTVYSIPSKFKNNAIKVYNGATNHKIIMNNSVGTVKVDDIELDSNSVNNFPLMNGETISIEPSYAILTINGTNYNAPTSSDLTINISNADITLELGTPQPFSGNYKIIINYTES